jgi:hypothetical protein
LRAIQNSKFKIHSSNFAAQSSIPKQHANLSPIRFIRLPTLLVTCRAAALEQSASRADGEVRTISEELAGGDGSQVTRTATQNLDSWESEVPFEGCERESEAEA